MSMTRFNQWLKLMLLVLFYAGVFFFAITFPSSFSWIIFYFFTFLFVGAYLTTLFSWGEASVSVQTLSSGQKQPTVTLQTKSRLPLLIPRLSFTLWIDSFPVQVEKSVLFKQNVSATFPATYLPRGRYTSVELVTKGQDLFHLFPYESTKVLSTHFDVLPAKLSDSVREKALKKVAPFLEAAARFGMDNDQFHQIREHQEYDTLKDIDWKTSFRKREWMVKEYEKEAKRPLTLCFFGTRSSHFEELVSLAYGLYGDIQKKEPIRLLLLGTFEGGVHLEQTSRAFVTIQPAPDREALMEVWARSFKLNERRIVVAPQKEAEVLKRYTAQPLIVLTEEDTRQQEV